MAKVSRDTAEQRASNASDTELTDVLAGATAKNERSPEFFSVKMAECSMPPGVAKRASGLTVIEKKSQPIIDDAILNPVFWAANKFALKVRTSEALMENIEKKMTQGAHKDLSWSLGEEEEDCGGASDDEKGIDKRNDEKMNAGVESRVAEEKNGESSREVQKIE